MGSVQQGTNILEHLWIFLGGGVVGDVFPRRSEAQHAVTAPTETYIWHRFVSHISYSWHRAIHQNKASSADTLLLVGTAGLLMGLCPISVLVVSCIKWFPCFASIGLILLGRLLCKVCLLHHRTYWKCTMSLQRRKRFWLVFLWCGTLARNLSLPLSSFLWGFFPFSLILVSFLFCLTHLLSFTPFFPLKCKMRHWLLFKCYFKALYVPIFL